MTTEKMTKGYKVTDSEMCCRDYQFTLGVRHTQPGKLKICYNGIHFCNQLNDCFNYYDFNSKNRVFEIIAYGDLDCEGDKSCCSEIEFLSELTWLEVLALVNIGKDNTGRANTGDRNTGNWNTGNWNTGYRNTGDSNTGDRNTGYRNTGNWNTGDRNTGDSNTGYRNTGAFCTNNNPKVLLFDVETEMSVREWEEHQAMQIMSSYLDITIFVDSSQMTEKEKSDYPTHETIGGYLRPIPYKEAWSNMWNNLTDKKKAVFTSLPNFDAAKFLEITGVDVNKEIKQ